MAEATRATTVRVTGPFASHASRAWGRGVALVGDAADFFDPFTGEGIYAALRGGELLAPYALESLAADRPRDADAALRAYDRARRRAFRGKWAIERLVALAVGAPALLNRAAATLEVSPAMAHLFVGVAGDFVPAREVLRPGYLAKLIFGNVSPVAKLPASTLAVAMALSTIDPATFRSVLGRFASGVTVVTVRDIQHYDHGMTVTAFCSRQPRAAARAGVHREGRVAARRARHREYRVAIRGQHPEAQAGAACTAFRGGASGSLRRGGVHARGHGRADSRRLSRRHRVRGARAGTRPAITRSSSAPSSPRRRTRGARCSTIAAATRRSCDDAAMSSLLTPQRRRGYEILDDPDVDDELRARSLADVARSNTIFGGSRAVQAELAIGARRRTRRRRVSLLDVGHRHRRHPRARAATRGARAGSTITTFGVDISACAAAPGARRAGSCPSAPTRSRSRSHRRASTS